MTSNKKRATAATVVATGVVAGALVWVAEGISLLFGEVFGAMWMSRVRHALVDWGVPVPVVAGYVAFILLHVPLWCVLIVLAFGLGLMQGRWAKTTMWALVVWLPIMDLVKAIYVLESRGVFKAYAGLVSRWQIYAGFGVRILPDLLTILVVLGAWLAGRLIRRRFVPPPPGPGHCPQCGYDLRGNVAAMVCPECGETIGSASVKPQGA